MVLSKPARRKRRRIAQRTTVADPADAEVAADCILAFINDGQSEFRSDLCLSEHLVASLNESQDEPEFVLESDDEVNDDYELEMLLEMDEQGPPDTLQPYLQPPPLLKRSSSATDLTQEGDEANTDAILELIDVATRLAISGCPTQVAKGVSVKKDASFVPLALIAPSLWAPGYLPAVASRAVFLPTISHALYAVCTRHATCETLMAKAAYLSQRVPTHCRQSNHRFSNASSRVSLEGLSIRLWQTLERGLYSPESARRLKPLHIKARHCTQESGPDHETLDASQESDGFTSFLEVEDDEELLLDAESEEDRYCLDDDLFDSKNEGFDYSTLGQQHVFNYLHDEGLHGRASFGSLEVDAEAANHSHAFESSSEDLEADKDAGMLLEEDTVSTCDSRGSTSSHEGLCVVDDYVLSSHCEQDTQEMLCI